jgi:uncharacterized protein (TIGR02996 family)
MTAAYAHPEYRQLLASVLAAPADDAPRLVIADWLDEHGCGERAAFIRAQCRYAAANPGVGAAPIADPEVRRLWEIGTGPGGFLEAPGFYGLLYWKRGFIESLRLPAADWLAHADAILAEHPVTAVTLTTWPRVGSAPPYGLQLDGRDWHKEAVPFLPEDRDGGAARGLLAAEWPGITFTLPPEPQGHPGTMTINGVPVHVRNWTMTVAPEVMEGDPAAPAPGGVINAATATMTAPLAPPPPPNRKARRAAKKARAR